MPRKNNSAQTIENIIFVSAKLFVEKGYDKTSMQDIVDAIGMSKGAIFHHFKSKEDILAAVTAKQSEYTEQAMYKWLDEMNGLTAKEKMIGFLERNMRDQQIHSLDKTFASQVSNPQFIIAQMQDCVNKSAKVFAQVMKEGLKDGSITTEFPDECAEVFFLLINIWCDPIIFKCDLQHLERRMKFLRQVMKKMGADIVSEELIARHIQFLEELYKGR